MESETKKGVALSFDDCQKIKDFSKFYVSAHVNRKFNDKLTSLMKQQFKDYAKLVGFAPKNVAQTYIHLNEQLFDSMHCKKLIIPKSPLVIVGYDKHIVRVKRKNGKPIFKLVEKNGSIYVKNELIFIKINGKWQIYYCL